MAVCTHNRGADRIFEAIIAGTALDLRMLIVLDNATGLIDQDLDTVADIDGLNAGATNIHSERIALTGEASAQDDGNNRANFDTNDVAFAAAPGVTAVGASVYIEGASDAARDLVASSTTGFPQPMDGGLNVTVTDLLRLATSTA